MFLLSPPTHNFFLVSNERYGKNKTFYSGAMILIQLKDIANYVLKLICSLCTPMIVICFLSP